MSLRSLRNRQESCTYRLNRAALMRMEEGRRKALTKEGYYDDRAICIQLGNKRSSKLGANQSISQSENETSRTEEDSDRSDEVAVIRKLKHFRRSNRDSFSISSYKPSRMNKSRGEISTNQKLRSRNKTKTSSTSYKDSESEDKELNVRRVSIEAPLKQKRRPKKRLQATQTASTLLSPALEDKAKAIQLRSKYSRSSSRSSDQRFQEKTGSPSKSKKINYQGNVAGPSSPSKLQTTKTDRKRKNEGEIDFLKSSLLGPMRMEPSYAGVTEKKPGSAVSKGSKKETVQVYPKSPLDDSLLIKPHKTDEELLEELKGAPREHSLEAEESREPLTKKEKISSAKLSSRKKSGLVRASQASKRLYFRPLPSTVTMTSDQEEVISKWRKRLGTSSPPANLYHKIGSPLIASSFLRDSQIFTVQGTDTPAVKASYSSSADINDLIPEKDSQDLENIEFKNFLRPLTGKGSKEFFTANEEQEIFLRLEMEKTKKQIHYLEELARIKVEKLEAIRWKKKRALEEEAVLNDKLEQLLYKIQELRERDSFSQILDKQTQVFATKKARPYV